MKNSPTLAHYNMLPEAEMHGLDNKIGEIGHVEDKEASSSNLVPGKGGSFLVPENSAVQVKSESEFA